MERVVDARGLEPPEPMELTLEAIGELQADDWVRLLIHRTPHLLFPILQEWGYAYHTHYTDEGTYEVLIWRKDRPGAAPPELQ